MINKSIQKETLELSEKERAELARLLIESLNPESVYVSEKDWSKELKHRLNCFKTGKSSTKSWSKAKTNAQKIVNE